MSVPEVSPFVRSRMVGVVPGGGQVFPTDPGSDSPRIFNEMELGVIGRRMNKTHEAMRMVTYYGN